MPAMPFRRSLARLSDWEPPSGAQEPSNVKKHYINVNVADLTERIVARDLATSISLRLKNWRFVPAAVTDECAAPGIRAATGRFRPAGRGRERLNPRRAVEARRRIDQFARIGVRRVGEQLLGLA